MSEEDRIRSRKESARKYREANKEKIKAWRDNNKEYIKNKRLEDVEKRREYWKKYSKKNREKINEKNKVYRANSKEKIKDWYLKNKEHLKKYQLDYIEKNKESINEKSRIRNKKNYKESTLDFIVVYCLPNYNKGGFEKYCGVTNNTKYRMKTHNSRGNNVDGWFVMHECKTRKEALSIEAEYHKKGYAGKQIYKNK